MFLTLFLTLLFPLAFCLIPLKKGSSSEISSFFSKEYTDVLKGICCIVVVYVHMRKGNSLQDAIGSFAYVCVTLFFLFSSYGMLLSVEKKSDYLKHFWRNRLSALLIPLFLINVASFACGYVKTGLYRFDALYSLNGYVRVLLEFCLWFYLVEIVKKKWFPKNHVLGDLLLIVGIVSSSLLLYLLVDAEVSAQNGWPFERIGLVWGILLYRYYGKFISWTQKHCLIKTVMLFLLSICLGVLYLKFKMVYFWGAYLLKIVLGLALIVFFFIFTEKRIVANKISSWLGGISYEVYLSHGMIMGMVAYYCPNINSGVFIFVSICIILIFSTLVHCIGKPIVKYLRK